MKKKMRRSKKREAKKEQKFSSNFLFLFAPLNKLSHLHISILYIYRLALRTEREGKDEGKEIDGIGGRRGDVDHARVFVLRE